MREHEILLGTALKDVLVTVGVLRKDAEPTGAELLVAASEYTKVGKSLAARDKEWVANILKTLDLDMKQWEQLKKDMGVSQ